MPMKDSPTPNQSRRIQVLRGLAIVAVVAIHCAKPPSCEIFLRPFLNFCVGLFLFLSGMLSDARTTNPWKRIRKIAIPYLLWTGIYSLYRDLPALDKWPGDFLSQAISGRANAAMYYIFVYCELTLLIPVWDKLAGSRYRYWGLALAPLSILLLSEIPLVCGFSWPGWFVCLRDISFFEWSSYYYLGYLMGNRWSSLKPKIGICGVLWVCSIGLQMLEGYAFSRLGSDNPGTQMKLSALLSGTLFCLLAFRFAFSGNAVKSWMMPLKLLGDRSFGIYFCHILVMWVLARIPGNAGFAILAETVVASYLFVWSVARFVPKYGKYLAC
jgi:surface polysaccharide O-acyltransferase-like enzyme